MGMSKQDFIALADYLRDSGSYCEEFTREQLEHLANFCHSRNPAFKRQRWLDYIAGLVGSGGSETELGKREREGREKLKRMGWREKPDAERMA